MQSEYSRREAQGQVPRDEIEVFRKRVLGQPDVLVFGSCANEPVLSQSFQLSNAPEEC